MERFEGWLARRAFHRRVRNAPRTAIADLDDGELARITGRVVPLDGQTLAAPFTGTPCVYFSVSTLFVGSRSGQQVLASNEQSVPFLLDDGERRAVIELDHTRVSIGTHHRTGSPATHFMNGNPTAGLIERRETIIAPGDGLVIVGVGIGEPDPERPPTALFRGTTARRFRFVGSEDEPILVSDEPALFATD